MKKQKIKSPFGTLEIDIKEKKDDENKFVGDVRIRFFPNFIERDDAKLECFSFNFPGIDSIDYYIWLLSWYDKKTGHLIEKEV